MKHNFEVKDADCDVTWGTQKGGQVDLKDFEKNAPLKLVCKWLYTKRALMYRMKFRQKMYEKAHNLKNFCMSKFWFGGSKSKNLPVCSNPVDMLVDCCLVGKVLLYSPNSWRGAYRLKARPWLVVFMFVAIDPMARTTLLIVKDMLRR